MQVNGVPNKYEIFQEYYLEVNGEQISYSEALRLFSQLDADEKTEFEKYYKDETGYEIIYSNGYNLEPEIIVETDENGKVKRDANGNVISNLGKLKRGYIATKYSIEAYAKGKGLVLDPIWSGYSAEEIIAMKNNGVNIPQDIVDIANTILQSTGANYITEDPEDDSQDNGDVTEKEPYLKLIPKAKKKIEKCNENNEKISDKIDELLPEKTKQERRLSDKVKEQRQSLEEYEARIREWRQLQDKINSGEALSDSEASRYAQLTGMLEDKNNSEDFEINKNQIARTLNDINILSVLGDELAEETIEISDTLSDYTSETNYKQTRNTAAQQIGFLRAIIAMAQGKTLAEETEKIGYDTKEYVSDTKQSVNDIASLLNIDNRVVSANELQNPESEPTDITETVTEESGTQPAQETITESDNNEHEETQEGDQEAVDPEASKEEDFIVNDEAVTGLIEEGQIINADLARQISNALSDIKVARTDKRFAKIADFKITRLVKQYNEEEEKREEEIAKLEEENEKSKSKLEELTGKSGDELDKEINNESNDKNTSENQGGVSESVKREIEQHKTIIRNNNQRIAEIQQVSEASVNEFKQNTTKEKTVIQESVPAENDALTNNSDYLQNIIPAYTQALEFTGNTGTTLKRMGTYRVKIGRLQIMHLQYRKGMHNISKGSTSAAIGIAAEEIADTRLPKTAETVTSSAVTESSVALTGLNKVDTQISSITGEETTQSSYDNQQSQDKTAVDTQENAQDTGDSPTEGTDTNNEDLPQNTEPQENPEPAVDIVGTNVNASLNNIPTTVPSANSPAGGQNPESTDNDVNPTIITPTNAPRITDGQNPDELVPEISSEEPLSSAPQPQGGSSTDDTTDEPTEEDVDPDSAQDDVDNIDASAKDDAKESKNIKKDTEKDKKTLEKETKTLTKLMKKDEQEIIKMTEESTEAAKKQEEILTEYETLVAENEQLVAEDQNNAPQPQPQPQQNDNDNALATNSMGIIIGAAASSGGNSKQIDSNNARLNELGVSFTAYGNTITRNSTRILRLQKTNTKRQKQFDTKTKTIQKKVKEEQKAEENKEKRLSKQLGAVGIAENVFSITTSTGIIMNKVGTGMIASGTAMLSNPLTAAAGAALISAGTPIQTTGITLTTVGTYGTIACGVTKATINIANGNLAAGLMSLGQTAISAATSLTGMGEAVNSTLQAVSAGLNVVSSSADLVNNVRAVQGKEANGFASKLSAVAGAGAALTSASDSFTGFKDTNKFGKSMKITQLAGAALSSTSELMTEFGADGQAANIIGMVGGIANTVSGIGQIANARMSKSSAENKENTKTNNTNESNSTEDANSPEVKAALDKKMQEMQAQIDKDFQTELTQLQQQSQTEMFQPEEFLNLETIPTETHTAAQPSETPLQELDMQEMQGLGTQKQELTFDHKIEGIDIATAQPLDLKQSNGKNWENILNAVSGATSVVSQVFSSNTDDQQQNQKKQAPPGRLTKRAKEIIEKHRRRVAALSKMQYKF